MEKFFYGTGLFSLLLGFVLATLTVLGLDGTSGHFEPGRSQSIGRIRFVSIHSIAALLLGFGWGGIVCLKIGLHPIVVTILSLGLGIILMILMYLLLVGIMGFQLRSRVDLSMAVGSIAEVYMTIPAKRSGKGKVRVHVGEDMRTVDAETNSQTSFKPGERVRVIERIAKSCFLVREK